MIPEELEKQVQQARSEVRGRLHESLYVNFGESEPLGTLLGSEQKWGVNTS